MRLDSEREGIPRTRRIVGADAPPAEPVLPGPLGVPRVPSQLPEPSSIETPVAPSVTSVPWLRSWLARGRRRIAIVAVGAVVISLLGWRALRSDGTHAEGGAAQASPSADAEPLPLRPCELAGSARKLADAIHLGVPLAMRQDASGRIALAYAATTTDAVGLTLDPVTLDAARAFSEAGARRLFGVLPSSLGGGDGFTTSRAAGSHGSGGLVELPGGVAHLSAGSRGLDVRIGKKETLVWPDAASTQNTSPRAEPVGSAGALLTWRRGGLGGEIVVGLLGPNGQARGAVTKITSSAQEFGTPNLTVGGEEALVSFASRSGPNGPWRIELARAPLGQLPAAARPFVPEGLSESASTLSPAAAALPGGGWLLQWTQGENGKHRVWLQTLDRTLAPVGAPFPAAPADAESGQGAPWAGADRRAATFYIVRAGQQWELWGTALECPR